MISYAPLWKTLEKKGLSKNKFKKLANKAPGLLTRLNQGKSITMHTLNDICRALDCKVENVIEYVKDEDDK